MVKVPYQQAVGSLMYAMLCTRPDLAYPISVVSQHMANPSIEHWIAIKHIFQYLQGILQFKLHFRGLAPQGLVGYCDADWANNFEDRRSTTRFVFIMGGGAISWSSTQSLYNDGGRIHGKYTSYQGSHMDDKVHEGIKVHEREEGNGDSM
jgi:hypothetical protein